MLRASSEDRSRLDSTPFLLLRQSWVWEFMVSKRHTTALIGVFLTATYTYQPTHHRNESNELYFKTCGLQLGSILIISGIVHLFVNNHPSNLRYNFKYLEKMVGIFQIPVNNWTNRIRHGYFALIVRSFVVHNMSFQCYQLPFTLFRPI